MARRVEALRLLVALLPLSNRDTLWALLTFLNLVTQHSTDSLDQDGNTLRVHTYIVHLHRVSKKTVPLLFFV